MAIRPILTAPDPRLKAVSAGVARVDGEIRKLVQDMADSMYAADGIGLAAAQIGVPKRVIVMDLTQKAGDQKEDVVKTGKKNWRAYINPKILWASDETAVFEEGCLSVPEIYDDVERPARIRAEYLDLDGNRIEIEADGMLATCLQHEMDHLEGVLFIDHLSRLKRAMLLKKLIKAKKITGLMSLRLAFLGTPDFAVPALAELIAQGHDIAAVYSQPPRPKGRGMETEPGPVHRFADTAKLQVRTPLSLKGADEQSAFAALNLDAAIVVAYGLILPKAILDAPRLGCFNLHGSLLPRWRGAAPIQRAVMAGDAETGVMVMHMDEGLDTGPVLMAERIAIGRKTSGELSEQLSRLGADLMVRALAGLERGSLGEHKQNEAGVTYAKKIAKDEARIDWSRSATEVDCLIRGLSPAPGAFSEVKGERLKILYAEPISRKGTPGEVIANDLTIACGEGALRLLKVQRAGGKAMDAVELLKGFALPPGAHFS